jgi:hypothetical protein
MSRAEKQPAGTTTRTGPVARVHEFAIHRTAGLEGQWLLATTTEG